MPDSEFENFVIAAARLNELPTLHLINDALEQHWLFAVSKDRREKLEVCVTRLCHITDRLKVSSDALAPSTQQYVSDWNMMFRLGSILLQRDTGYKSLRLLRVVKIPHAEAVLEFMSQTPSALTKDVAAHFEFGMPKARKIMRQLHGREFITPLARNWYTLTQPGRAAVNQLKKERFQLEILETKV